MAERRSKYEIIYDILKLISEKNGKVKPTHILYGGNLSHDRLKKYLKELIDGGFIQQTNEKGKMFYQLSEKGYKFIEEFKKIEEMTAAFGI
ncbi:MAG TPA: winged helix-turn-helix domain-containing protein [Candidatus Nanoarchaeia archaeon]|nr:winged helix-turn-helix domain-containing protein [Candidatus Nanoarchaeia archaeon]